MTAPHTRTTTRDEMVDHAEHLIRSRRAVRAFRPDPVPPDTMRAIFALANGAPSNSNTQPWTVEVVSGSARDRLAEALSTAHARQQLSVDFPYRDELYNPQHQRRRSEFGETMYTALGIARENQAARDAHTAEGLRFYGAPHVALLCTPADADARMTADVGMYGQTLLLAMTAHGIASCPQGLLGFYGDTVRETLGISGTKILFGVSFGYALASAPVNNLTITRAELHETTRFHT
ncbi:nitroreductase [Nocardia macrotermitis]|uniref:Nitroreductase NfnB n=1 Tax=Nocardia macrotermitis TaxID=2585198 RepID=A0A7K0DBS9_9NOCA|nr:nitroreductase [Nocardia macrotermitis]MQY22344.1 Nitroreductase NfnB [Nocardia macrotermitis]